LAETNQIASKDASFTISSEIDAGKISAESRDGVLTVHLPKPEKAKPKKIAVKAV
jgi:HSP20 family protein